MKVTEYKNRTVIEITQPCLLVVEEAGETTFEVTAKYGPELREIDQPPTPAQPPTPEPVTEPATPDIKTPHVFDVSNPADIAAYYLSKHMDVPTDEKTVNTLISWAKELQRQLSDQGQALGDMSLEKRDALIEQMLGHWKQGPSK